MGFYALWGYTPYVTSTDDGDQGWQRVRNIRVPTDTKPDGHEYGSEFVPAGTGASTTLNPTDIFKCV